MLEQSACQGQQTFFASTIPASPHAPVKPVPSLSNTACLVWHLPTPIQLCGCSDNQFKEPIRWKTNLVIKNQK